MDKSTERQGKPPEQIRAARGLLNWSARQLSEASGVSLSSILNFENKHSKMMALNMKAIIAALEKEGVEFIEDGAKIGVMTERKKVGD